VLVKENDLMSDKMETTNHFVGPPENVNTGPGEPESPRLFIGQVPKSMEADDLRKVFEGFGKILDISILKDKATGVHKGCAFLTYLQRASADAAIETLHNRHTLPNAKSSIQVKYSNEKRNEVQDVNEWKLFVGMLPKTAAESDLENIFSRFGEIEELRILRGADGESKGCAFIKFKSRQMALSAISEINGKYEMQGSKSALVVRFAAPQKHKEGKFGEYANARGVAPTVIGWGYAPQPLQPVVAYSLNEYGQQEYFQQFYYAPNAGIYPPVYSAMPLSYVNGNMLVAPVIPFGYAPSFQNPNFGEDRRMKKGANTTRMHPY